MVALTAIVLAGLVHARRPAIQAEPTCLHETGSETPEQHERRVKAIGVTRLINSAEATYSANAGQGYYATIDEMLSVNAIEKVPVVPGFEVHLNVLKDSYWFEVVDTTDPCGFRFISNQSGVIFTAEPIR